MFFFLTFFFALLYVSMSLRFSLLNDLDVLAMCVLCRKSMPPPLKLVLSVAVSELETDISLNGGLRAFY